MYKEGDGKVKKIFTDLLLVFAIVAFMMLMWSYANTIQTSTIILIIIMLFIFIANIFFIIKRKTSNIVERLIYDCLFFITSSFIFAALLIDDHGYILGIKFLLVSFLVLFIMWIVLYKEFLIKRYSKNTQNLIVFSISIFLALLSLISIVG